MEAQGNQEACVVGIIAIFGVLNASIANGTEAVTTSGTPIDQLQCVVQQ